VVKLDIKSYLKQGEARFYLSAIGSVLIFGVFYKNFSLLTAILFLIGITIISINGEIYMLKRLVKKEEKEERAEAVNFKNILLTATGIAFIISALIDVLTFKQLLLFGVGIGLTLLPLQRMMK
jgi:hypothetical protein